jgi:hypothetical protein
LQFPDQSWAIIDCGEKSGLYEPHNQAAIFLKNEKPTETPVRFILATHPDSDHDGGIRQLLQLLYRDVHAIYYSGVERQSMIHCGDSVEDREMSFVTIAAQRLKAGEIHEFKALQQDDEIKLDPPIPGLSIKVLWPLGDWIDSIKHRIDFGRRPDFRNNCSVVLKIEYAGHVVILPGDIQGETVNGKVFSLLKGETISVIKAPHHGAKGSLIPWDIVNDKDEQGVLLISCPTDDEKHPHKNFYDSISTGHKRWIVRCTGLASFCKNIQEPSKWPLPAVSRSFLPLSMLSYLSLERSFLSIGGRGRTYQLETNDECCLHNEVRINKDGTIEIVEISRVCDHPKN